MEEKNSSEVEKEVKEVKEEVVLPGFRFHPTDEELVGFYLLRKVENKRISIEIIKEIDIYKYDPWDLPKASSVGGETTKECYFFSLRGRKYRNSIRPNRVTGSGFWKATGIDRPIYSSEPNNNNNCNIGLKKSLVYYRGSAGKGTKTDWMMHEFRLPPNTTKTTISPSMQEAEVWTICRIFKRNITCKKFTIHNWQQSSLSSSSSSSTTTTITQQTTDYPADSSWKTSSLDSDTGHEYRYNMGCASTLEQGESFINQNYIEEKRQSQIHGGQWINPTVVQSPPQFKTTPHHHYHQYSSVHGPIPSLINVNELQKEGNWDEFGRMMDEYMMDT